MKRFDFLTGTFEIDDDALFGAEQAVLLAPMPTARITCRVCERPAEVALDSAGLLCRLCREDLDATDEHISSRHHKALWAAQDAWDRMGADVAHADEATLARWNAFQDAITASDPRAAETERRVAAGGIHGDFAGLVRRWLDWKTTLDAMGHVERWARVAHAEVQAARDE